MSRNIRKANKIIFNKLSEYSGESGIPNNIYIYISPDEKSWAEKIKILERKTILQNLKVATLEYENNKYILLIGWETVDFDKSVIESVNFNAGIVVALLSELDISVRDGISENEILQNILFQQEDPDYKGHSFEDVMPFFEPLNILKIPQESLLYGKDLMKIMGYMICLNRKNITLPYSAQSMEAFEKCFLESTNNIPYENLVLALVASQWKFAFLDAYRCLEHLFSFNYLEDLSNELDTALTLGDLSAHIENYLGWKPKEDEALKKIFEAIPQDTINIINAIKENCGDTTMKADKWYYKLRNSIVHFRPATESTNLGNDDWDKLIDFTIYAIRFLYEKYNKNI